LKAVLANKLNFNVMESNDETYDAISRRIDSIARLNHVNSDCLLVVVMTHGDENGEIDAHDLPFHVNELWKKFLGDRCKSLVGKPKLFFIQACRGDKRDKGVRYDTPIRDDTDSKNHSANFVIIPLSADCLIMYASTAGFVSFRNIHDGSWFIQELCKQLETNTTDDLLSLLTIVNRNVAQRQSIGEGAKQMPIVLSSLTKKVYFHDRNRTGLANGS